MWWAAAFLVWLISAAWILYVMADVFRNKKQALAPALMPAYGFHGATAILALWLVFKALEG